MDRSGRRGQQSRWARLAQRSGRSPARSSRDLARLLPAMVAALRAGRRGSESGRLGRWWGNRHTRRGASRAARRCQSRQTDDEPDRCERSTRYRHDFAHDSSPQTLPAAAVAVSSAPWSWCFRRQRPARRMKPFSESNLLHCIHTSAAPTCRRCARKVLSMWNMVRDGCAR